VIIGIIKVGFIVNKTFIMARPRGKARRLSGKYCHIPGIGTIQASRQVWVIRQNFQDVAARLAFGLGFAGKRAERGGDYVKPRCPD
jgi:hypothetical protein